MAFFKCPGKISNFYYSLSHSTVFCFNLRGLEPSFASPLEKGGDCYKYKKLYPCIMVVSAFSSDALLFC